MRMSIESLQELPGIGPATAKTLVEAGYVDAEALNTATVDDLTRIPGFGPSRAQALLDAVAAAFQPDAVGSADETESLVPPEGDQTQSQEPPAKEKKTRGKAEKQKKRGKRRKAARAKLDARIENLEQRRADVKVAAKKAGRRVDKAGSKKKRAKRAEDVAVLRRRAKRLKRKIEELKADRARI